MTRQVRVHGPNDTRVDDVAPPDPGPRDVVVQVAVCGICGTDLSYISHGGLAGPGPEPMALGHEMAGVVDWVGSDVEGVAIGDRVVVHPGNDELGRIGNGAPEGGLTPALLVREAVRGTRLFPVPDAVPLDIAALTEPLDVGMHAVEQSDAAPATDVFIEASGAPQVITAIIERARRDARLSVVALHYDPVPVSFMLLMAKQLTIRGSIEYPERFEAGLELLQRRDLSPMITHRVPLDRFGDALATLSASRDCGKVMVTMGMDS